MRLASLRGWVLPIVLLTMLDVYARTIGAGSDSVAPPSLALLALLKAVFSVDENSVWMPTVFTLGSAAVGLAIGMVLGLIFGIILGLSPRLARMSFLSVEVFRPVPSVALIPLSMLIFGFGLRLEASVVAFATFWPMLILSQVAAQQVEPRLLEVSNALGLSVLQRTWKILLPAMVPRLFVALRLGVAIALVVAVTVEIAVNPQGMGYAIIMAQQSLDPALMMGWLFWVCAVGYAVNALAGMLEHQVARRMGVRR
jgi:sulfonate transport system permease protein